MRITLKVRRKRYGPGCSPPGHTRAQTLPDGGCDCYLAATLLKIFCMVLKVLRKAFISDLALSREQVLLSGSSVTLALARVCPRPHQPSSQESNPCDGFHHRFQLKRTPGN